MIFGSMGRSDRPQPPKLRRQPRVVRRADPLLALIPIDPPIMSLILLRKTPTGTCRAAATLEVTMAAVAQLG